MRDGGRGSGDEVDDDMPDPGALTLDEVHGFLMEMANEVGGGDEKDDQDGQENDGESSQVPGLVFVGL